MLSLNLYSDFLGDLKEPFNFMGHCRGSERARYRGTELRRWRQETLHECEVSLGGIHSEFQLVWAAVRFSKQKEIESIVFIPFLLEGICECT